MSTADDLHSELGALEEQVERLGELKSLIERLEATKRSARAAADAAEKATRANKQVVDSFDNVAGRIEQSDAVQQLEELENQIERLKRAREEVEEELGLLGDWLEIELEDHRSEVLGTFTEKLEKQSNVLDERLEEQSRTLENELESQAEDLDQLRDVFGKHQSEIKSKLEEQVQSLSATLGGKLETQGNNLGRLRDLVEKHHEDQEERLTSLKEEVGQIHSVLKDAELVSRLERITDTSKSASQAAQNTLSRIEAVERNLGQSISQNHDRREDAEEKTHDAVATLKTQTYVHIALSIGILAVLALEVFGVI